MRHKIKTIVYMGVAILFMGIANPYKISAKENTTGVNNLKPKNQTLITVSGDKVIDSNGTIVVDPEKNGLTLFTNKRTLDFKMALHRQKMFMKDVKFGYKDKRGKIIVPAKYCEAKTFYNGVAWVALPTGNDYVNPKWGLINAKGNYIINHRFSVVSQFTKDGLAFVGQRNNKSMLKYGIVSKTGKIIIEPKYDKISAFSEGLATVKLGIDPNDKYGVIDRNGKIIVEPKYDYIGEFKNGFAIVAVGEGREYGQPLKPKYGVIDNKGKLVIEPQYKFITNFSKEGLAIFEIFNGHVRRCGIIDKTGKIVLEPKYEFIPYDSIEHTANFDNGVAVIKTGDSPFDGECGIVDKNGKIILQPEYHHIEKLLKNDIGTFTESMYDSKTSKVILKSGLIDKTGKILVKAKYDEISSLGDGLAGFRQGNKWGYIDYKGNVIIKPQFSSVESFTDGLGTVWNGDTNYVINKQGKVVFKLTKGKVLDSKGKVIYNGNVASMECEKGGFISIMEPFWDFTSVGYINSKGKLILDPKKTRIYDCENIDYIFN